VLPPPTRDIEQAKADLASFGLCLIPEALSEAGLEQARATVYAAAAQDNANGRRTTDFALDTNESNQRVWNLLNRDPIFTQCIEHPTALALVKHLLGWPALLSNISGNISGPGASLGVLHADQIFVPEPWPQAPQGINALWCLDDFTATNGATLVAPGSHTWHRPPAPDESVDMVPVHAPAGTLCMFESRMWHRAGANTTKDQYRAGVFAFYSTPTYRTQENWFVTLSDEYLATVSDDVLTLLAYKSEGFGLAYGRSPR